MESTKIISIDFQKIRKGDVISNDQVEHHFIKNIIGEEKYKTQVAEFERGERPFHPICKAHQQVSDEIMKKCRELGYPVVCRSKQKTVEVLTDSEAMEYRTKRANSALGLHRRQVKSLNQDIDESNLTNGEKRQLEHSRNYHTMIELSIASGKKTLKAINKGALKGSN